MQRIRFQKSGVSVYILAAGETCPEGEICFHQAEWELARRVGKRANDPDAEKEFWQTVLEKKQADPAYNVAQDFPEMEGGSGPGADPTLNAGPSANGGGNPVGKDSKGCADSGRGESVGDRVCREVLEMLRGRGARTRRERDEGESA